MILFLSIAIEPKEVVIAATHWLSDHSDLAQLAASLMIFCSSVVASMFVLQAEYKRRLRFLFRQFVEQRLPTAPNLSEHVFADKILDSISKRDFDSLKKIDVERYVQDYIVDYDFKLNVYSYLVEQIQKNNIEISKDSVKEALRSIDSWKTVGSFVENDILKFLEELAPKNSDAVKVKRFIESRDGYFETKANEFVTDVKQAVEFAAAA